MLASELIAMQGVGLGKSEYSLQLHALSKMPMTGTVQEYCVPKQEMAWLLDDCKDVREFHAKLKELVECSVPELKVGDEAKKSAVLLEELQRTRSELEKLREIHSAGREGVSLLAWEGLQKEFAELRDEYNKVIVCKETSRAENDAYWASLRCYWRREVVMMNRLASQEVEVNALTALVGRLGSGVPKDVLDMTRLNCRVKALEQALQSDFVERMVHDRSDVISKALKDSRDYEVLRLRKNRTIQQMAADIWLLERALGRTCGDAGGLSEAETKLMNLRQEICVLEDDAKHYRATRTMQGVATKQELHQLEALHGEVRQMEGTIKATRADMERWNGESQRAMDAMGAARAELAAVRVEIDDCRTGANLKKHSQDIFTLNEQRECLQSAVDGLRRDVDEHTEALDGMRVSIREAEAELARLDGEKKSAFAGRSPSSQSISTPPPMSSIGLGPKITQTGVRLVGDRVFTKCEACGQCVPVDEFGAHCTRNHQKDGRVFACERGCGFSQSSDSDWDEHYTSAQCVAAALVVAKLSEEVRQETGSTHSGTSEFDLVGGVCGGRLVTGADRVVFAGDDVRGADGYRGLMQDTRVFIRLACPVSSTRPSTAFRRRCETRRTA